MSGEERGTRAAAIVSDARTQSQHVVTRPLASGSADPPSATSNDARGSRSKFLVCSASPLMRKIGSPFFKGDGHERAIGMATTPAREPRVQRVPVEIWATNVCARSAP